MRMVADANCAGAHGQAAGLDSGVAERDGVGGGKFAGQRLAKPRRTRECFAHRQGAAEPCDSQAIAGVANKFPALDGFGIQNVPPFAGSNAAPQQVFGACQFRAILFR